MTFLVFQELFHNFAKSFKIYCGKLRRTSIPNGCLLFLNCYRGEVLEREVNCSYTTQ